MKPNHLNPNKQAFASMYIDLKHYCININIYMYMGSIMSIKESICSNDGFKIHKSKVDIIRALKEL